MSISPETAKKLKQAVDQGAIDSIPYEKYKALTQEEADKMIDSVKDKVDFSKEPAGKSKEVPGKDAPGKDAPAQEGANEKPTKFQYRAIAEAVKNGEMEELPKEQWEALTKASAGKIIGDLHAKRPPEQATQSQMKMVDELLKEGRIFPMKAETYHTLSKGKASSLISIGLDNREKNVTVEGFDPNYVQQRNQPMTDEQKKEITRLVKDGRLNGVAPEKWKAMTQEEAGKLIFRGQEREAANQMAPEFNREKSPAEPKPQGQER